MKKIVFPLVLLLLTTVILPFTTAFAASSAYAQTLVYVQQAEKSAARLRQETSIEYRKKAYPANPISLPKMEYYNDAKNKLKLATERVTRLPLAERRELETRLNNNVSIHITRAQAYIDAINQGAKTLSLTEDYKKKYQISPTSNDTEKAFHLLSKEINKQAVLLYRVYGKSTREAILAKYKSPGEKILDDTRATISLKMEMDRFVSIYFTEDIEIVKSRLKLLEKKIWDFKDLPLQGKLARYLDESFT